MTYLPSVDGHHHYGENEASTQKKINLPLSFALRSFRFAKSAVLLCHMHLFGLDRNTQYQDLLGNYLGILKQFIKVTRFSENDEETFYREREWRSINGNFIFTPEEVEAIIVPREFIPEVMSELLSCEYENHISIIPFEFLEKV